MPRNFPIDLVYLWVDGSDPAYLAERARYSRRAARAAVHPQRITDNEELRHSLRSANAYAPWLRKIFIVTNHQWPWWLLKHDKIEVIDAATLFPNKAHAPSFSSMAIECHLHRIPGLAEHFLYANDDMFFGAKVKPEDFYTADDKMRMGLDPNKKIDHRSKGKDIIGVGNAVRELQALGIAAKYQPLHMIKPYTKSLFQKIDKKFPALVEKTSRERFRSRSAIGFNTTFAPHFALHEGMAINRHVSWTMAGLSNDHSQHRLNNILKRRPKLFCLNNGSKTNAAQLAKFWKELGLGSAPWELNYRDGGAADRSLWQDVLRKNYYRLPRAFDFEDTIIDIGAHTGSFAHACLIRGAGKVLCFEPSAENFALLQKNLAGWGDRVQCVRAAVTSEPTAILSRSRTMPKRMGRLSIVGDDTGESVPVVHPTRALELAGGPVRLLKLDCEGSEYDILSHAGSLAPVDAVACEWHRILHRGREWKASDAEKILAGLGFECRAGSEYGPTKDALILAHRHNRPLLEWEQITTPTKISEALACLHRGAQVRTVKCELCSKKNETAAVFACDVYGECTLRRYKSGKSERTCLGCESRE